MADDDYSRRKKYKREDSDDDDVSRRRREIKDRDKDRAKGRERDRERSRDKESRKSDDRDDSVQPKNEFDGIIKATVTESNGEISCSIEETDRIRIALGLKPLNVKQDKEKEAVENHKAKVEEMEKVKEENEIRDRLNKLKTKRQLNEKLAGPTLGEITNEEEGELLSTAEWVRRSRKKELSEREKSKLAAELSQKRREEEEEENLNNVGLTYKSTNLAGLTVKHSMKEFESGEDVILTLADSNVLEKDEQGRIIGISETADELENVNIADTERRLERERIAKRARQPVYAGYDDAEFAEGVVPGTRPSILAQYDKVQSKSEKLILNEEGNVTNSAENRNNNDLQSTYDSTTGLKKVIPQSLLVEKKDIVEYYTHAEFSKFSKPKKEKKKRKKIRKHEVEDDVEVDSTKDIPNLDDVIGAVDISTVAMDTETSQADRGSRADKKAKNDAIYVAERRKAGYEAAVKLAGEKSEKAFLTQSQSLLPSKGKSTWLSEVPVEGGDEEDDADIAISLARARRVALAQQRLQAKREAPESYSEDAGADKVQELMKLTVDNSHINGGAPSSVTIKQENTHHTGSNGMDLGGVVDAEGRREDGTLVFTDTTEFTARLQARLNEKARSRAEAVVREQERREKAGEVDEEGFAVLEGLRKRRSMTGSESMSSSSRSGWKEIQSMEVDDAPAAAAAAEDISDVFGVSESKEEGEDSDQSEDGGDDQMAFVHRQPLVARGMAATLSLLKSTGELKKSDELAGRAKDERLQDPSATDLGVKIEYRDEYGRKLTQKEAFRQLSYRFHGHGPGKKKKEARLKILNAGIKAATSRGALDSGTMLSLTRAQEATGKAHLTIQGGLSSSTMSTTAELAQAIAKKKARAEKEKLKTSGSGTSSSVKK